MVRLKEAFDLNEGANAPEHPGHKGIIRDYGGQGQTVKINLKEPLRTTTRATHHKWEDGTPVFKHMDRGKDRHVTIPAGHHHVTVAHSSASGYHAFIHHGDEWHREDNGRLANHAMGGEE